LSSALALAIIGASALDNSILDNYHLVMQPEGHAPAAQTRLDATFAALADPTRRAILARLSSGEASVKELVAPFAITQAAISKHLKALERAGLIARGRDAQRRPSRLVAGPLAEASDWLQQYSRFWQSSFQRLDGLLGELKTGEEKQEPGRKHARARSRVARPGRARNP
jgi:DNA-binding transcriptional ArsR family regulator